MIVTKKALPRRVVLRGIGATLALPLLDAMVPAFAAAAQTPAQRINRLGVVYVPNGLIMENWTPATVGANFDLPPTLQPLAAFKDKLLVLTGLNGNKQRSGAHAGASTKFLTGTPGKRTAGAGQVEAGISMDQYAATELGKHTQLASLEMATETSELGGSCDRGVQLCIHEHNLVENTKNAVADGGESPRSV